MATETLEQTETKLPEGYPFHIGTRVVNHLDADGELIETESVPLEEWDFLHPQEEDRFMLTDAHSVTVDYLRHAIITGCRDLKGIRVFTEHRIDWQIGGIEPHGPDLAVFDRFTGDWNPFLGTLPVADVGAEIVAVFEVTSPSTRKIDIGTKFDEYAEVGVPYYVIVDIVDPDRGPNIRGYRLAKGKYIPMRYEASTGSVIPALRLWFRWEKNRIVVADEDGRDIPDSLETARQLEDVREIAILETRRADIAEQLVEAASVRAEAEAARAAIAETAAHAEKTRADALAAELVELKAKLNEAQ